MQPPNPAPVIRAATTPGVGGSDLDERVEFGRDDLVVVAERCVAGCPEPPDLGEVARLECRHRGFDAHVLLDDVAAATERRLVDPSRDLRQHARRHVAERADGRLIGGERGDRRFALGAPGVVLRRAEAA